MLLVVTDVNIKTELGFTPLHYSAKYLPRIFNENEATDVESATVNVTEIRIKCSCYFFTSTT